jgi:RNA polymerase sigma-70 factor (ECF subfamily)
MEPATRHSLVLRLKNHEDEEAWAEFVRIYEPLIFALAKHRGIQEADAQDLCQDVFQAVASAIERWDPAKGRFRAWLFRIARNHLLKMLERQRRNGRGTGNTSVQQMLEAHPQAEPAMQAEFVVAFKRRAFQWAADEVRGEFTASTWQAFWKTGVDNLRVRDVARELRLSEGAVYIARSRVLARLRAAVQRLTTDIDFDPGEGSHDNR